MAVRTLYHMDLDGENGGPYRLHWLDAELEGDAKKVDVARSNSVGDVQELTFYTGTDRPRITSLESATAEPTPASGSVEAYPYRSCYLGCPAPEEAPDVSIVGGTPSDQTDINILNPSAEDDTIGWISNDGELLAVDSTMVPGLVPPDGDFVFSADAAATTEAMQAIPEVELTGGSQVTLTWYQAAGANGSKATMGVKFKNSDDEVIGEAGGYFAPMIAVGTPAVFEQRTLTAVAPNSTVSIELYQRYEKVGSGETDAYIDDISFGSVTSNNAYDGSSLTDWKTETSGTANIVVDDDTGMPAPSFLFQCLHENSVAMYRNFDVQKLTQGTLSFELSDFGGEFDTKLFSVSIGATPSGAGDALIFGAGSVEKATRTTFLGQVRSEKITTLGGNYFDVKATIAITNNGKDKATLGITINQRSSGAELYKGDIEIDLKGDNIGFAFWGGDDRSVPIWLDNIAFDGEFARNDPDEVLAPVGTSYVSTYVNKFGHESAPSPPSKTILRPASSSTAISALIDFPDGYAVEKIRFYRAAVPAGGVSDYFFLNEQNAVSGSSVTFADMLDDDKLGEVLEPTEDWVLPPENGRGILAIANGITVMFADNQVCPSPINRPHTYPTKWRLGTDAKIVGMGAIDTDVIVLTQSHPYVVSGADPALLDMKKLEKPQGCVSERSIVTMQEFGVVYASPDGLVAARRGNVTLLTEGVISRKEWQALDPVAIIGVTHDGRYFGFYGEAQDGSPPSGGGGAEGGGFIGGAGEAERGGFIFDPRQGGNGWTRLNFYATAAFSNPFTDKLELVIDDEVYEWDGHDNKRPYRYRSKLHLLDRPTSFELARVRAADYENLTFRLFYDGEQVIDKIISNAREFILPDNVAEVSVQWELEGTSKVLYAPDIAETIEEI